MEKSKKITVLSCIVLIGFVFGVFYHYVLGFYLGLPYPLNTFLSNPVDHFTDFLDMVTAAQNLAPYKGVDPWINYFPLAYLFAFPFSFIKMKLMQYLVYILICLSFFLPASIKNFHCKDLSGLENFQNIFILTVLTYPLLCCINNGNIDFFLLIPFAGFVYYFKKEKYFICAFLLAFMNAIKPFYLIFLALFLFNKKYKELFYSIILTVFLVAGGFMLLHGNFYDQIVVLIKNLTTVKISYIYSNKDNFGMFDNSSLFMALKFLLTRLSLHPTMQTWDLVKIYNTVSVIVTLVVLFFAYREKAYWKQISLMTLFTLSIPCIVNDYKLILLFVPVWLFVNADEKTRFDWLYTILFGLLLIQKNIKILDYLPNGYDVSLSIVLNPLFSLSILVLIIIDQILPKKETPKMGLPKKGSPKKGNSKKGSPKKAH